MPKAKGRNAFFFFMIDWKKRAEARGCTFPNGLKDVQADPDCNEEWQNLTKQERGPYEAQAKKDKITSQINANSKKTTHGECIQLLEQKEIEEQKFIEDMYEYLESTITRAVNHNVLPQLKFCFVHVNWFFTKLVDNVVEYFPAEYAVGVFSLENGIEDIHHTIVGVPIPLGYRREALETSQSTHNIPIECPGEESDFAIMYEKLTNFLKPRKIVDKYPPLYTTKSLKGAVQSLLATLCKAANQDEEQFLVYEIESLFKHLADEAYKKREDREIKYTKAYAEYTFTRFTHIYKRGNECIFHKYTDGGSEYCSKSVLHQWTWNMCEEFCNPLQVEMKSGVHYPEEADCSYKGMMQSMANLDIKREVPQESELYSVISSTGVSQQHRIRVSERSYEDEMRRRKESKPVLVIDYSKTKEASTTAKFTADSDESVDKAIDEPVSKPTDEPEQKSVPNYIFGKPMRPPNTVSYVAATMDDYLPKNDEKNFPPIGGRGVLYRKIKEKSRKAPMGRGQGHA
ncbi:protein maelstrom homolog isoform X2 [Harpegnathos saltator]|uniref:protein maelstrom homolog isoform X2 n=1 Tax=Harpegnathos saltator TaxID=610380 RepID=UPI00058D4273|nr:protein maelstrom homolog isoform X2 [Harpegnathos saltator]